MITRLQTYWIKYGYDILQIALNVLLFVFGLATCISLGTIYNYFGSECILFANLNMRLTTNSSVKINDENSKWGSQDVCDYTTYVAVVSVVHAFIWTWFFLHMRSAQHSQG